MLIIHVGLHKTGSTAIQASLAKMSRRELSGFTYLGSHSPANNDGYLPRVSGSSEPGFVAPATRHSTTTKTEKVLSEGGNVILSSEGFLGSMRNLYPNAGDRAREMWDHFSSITDFRIVVYLRPQTTWLESIYTQMIQQGESLRVDDFLRDAFDQRNISLTNLVADLKDAVGPKRIIVRPYSAGTDVVADFLSVLRLPLPDRLKRQPRANMSISTTQAALMRLVNETSTSEESQDVRHFFQNVSPDRGKAITTEPGSLVPTQLQQEIKTLSLQDFRDLKEEVEDTTLPITHHLDQIIQEISTQPIKPYIESEWTNHVVAKQAAVCIRDASSRLRPDRSPAVHLFHSVERKIRTNPRGLPNATYRYLARHASTRLPSRNKT